MTKAGRLGSIGGGGTNCSAPVRLLNQRKAKADLVIFVSDNESWVDQGRGRGTALLAEWSEFRQRNPKARLVCLDIQPNQTTQAAESADILNIGGFSDQVRLFNLKDLCVSDALLRLKQASPNQQYPPTSPTNKVQTRYIVCPDRYQFANAPRLEAPNARAGT